MDKAFKEFTAATARRKVELDEKKLLHQESHDGEKLKLESKKIDLQARKTTT